MSIGRVIVRPTPTAAPLIAAIDGLRHSKIASTKRRGAAPAGAQPNIVDPCSAPNAPAPAEMSAPAQNPRPAPVTMITRTASSMSARSNASESSRPIWAV